MKRKEFLTFVLAAPFLMTLKSKGMGREPSVRPTGLCCEDMERFFDFINRLPVCHDPEHWMGEYPSQQVRFRYQDIKIHTKDNCGDLVIPDHFTGGQYVDSLWCWTDPKTHKQHSFGFGFSYCPFCGHKYGGWRNPSHLLLDWYGRKK